MKIVHPLTEVHPPSNEIPEETINLWGYASIIVDEVRQDNEVALEIFEKGIRSFKPLVDFTLLLSKIKRGDEPTIMLAINWLKESMELELDKTFKNE